MTQHEIRTIVTTYKKIIAQLDAQRTIAQNAIYLIQDKCPHIVTTHVGPYDVCDACEKIIK